MEIGSTNRNLDLGNFIYGKKLTRLKAQTKAEPLSHTTDFYALPN